MAVTTFDLGDVKRRMQGAVNALKHDLGSLRTGRASAEPARSASRSTPTARSMPINQVATVSVPEPRLLSVQVWDRGMVHAVEKAIRDSDLGLNPLTEGQIIRLRIPEMNEQRRKEMVKVAHKYAEEARVAVRHVRRDGLDLLKKLEKDGAIERGRRAAARPSRSRRRPTNRLPRSTRCSPRKEKEIMQV